LEDLVVRLRGEQTVRAGILMPVDRFHRDVQKEFMPGSMGDVGLLREIVCVGHEGQGQRTPKPDHLGGARAIEAEIIDHHRDERPIAARRRRNGETHPCRPRVADAGRRAQCSFLDGLGRRHSLGQVWALVAAGPDREAQTARDQDE
jgi:hypothetical protein